MINANESTNCRNREINKLREDLQPINLHRLRHGTDEEPETHQRNTSSNRIDYMFGSTRVAEATLQAGIEAYGEGYSSDHQGLFVDIDAKRLLNGEIAELDTPDGRGINSKSPKVVVKYKEHEIKYFRDHNVTDRIRRLDQVLTKQNQLSEDDKVRAKETLDAIDRDVTRVMLTAEAEIRKRNPYTFSPTLIKALHTQQFWQLWRKKLKTG
jgi:hypothetical protein